MPDVPWSNVDEKNPKAQKLGMLEWICCVKPTLPQWEDPEDVTFTNTVTNRAGKTAQWIGLLAAKETPEFCFPEPTGGWRKLDSCKFSYIHTYTINKQTNNFFLFVGCVSVCLCMCQCVHLWRPEKDVRSSLGDRVTGVRSCPTWVLGVKMSAVRAASFLNHWAISPVPKCKKQTLKKQIWQEQGYTWRVQTWLSSTQQ